MTWEPANTTGPQHCFENVVVTTCQPEFLIFLTIVSQYLGHSIDDKYRNLRNEEEYLFDFIVVGAGSAGCVVANRLSEKKNWKVLLLEAGDEEPLVSDAPGLTSLLFDSTIDYGYKVPGAIASTCEDFPNACRAIRGKTMGGTSSLNYMAYVRGSRHDYDEYAEVGNTGWSWEDVLPYFKKSENLSQPISGGNPDNHGTKGPLGIDTLKATTVEQTFLDGWKELGYNEIDYNSGDQIGASLLQYTVKDGIRQSSNQAFIRPIRGKRPNLTVRSNSEATKIIINPITRRAIGVKYVHNGVTKNVYASKEVILSAGSFASPKLLMLSGIGPAKDLRRLGIRVLKDLPVGRNLQDQVTMTSFVAVLNASSTTFFDPLVDKAADVQRWAQNKDGPLKEPGSIFNNIAFFQSALETRPGHADIEVLGFGGFNDVDKNGTQSTYAGFSYQNVLSIAPVLVTPKSRGWVKLSSSNPVRNLPEVNLNVYDHPDDLKALVDGAKKTNRLLETEAFKNSGLKFIKPPAPKCQQYVNDDDKFYECTALRYYFGANHAVGTCKMGPNSDPEAVVDPRLKVRGIKGLRVIDLSVLPCTPRANTNAPAMMIGEKGSDMIKQDWL